VHSAKDLPTVLPNDLVIAGYLPREDVRDAYISLRARTFMDLPKRAVVGSASLRRQAQMKRWRPDLRMSLLRGNVGTRLAKLERGEVVATLLAMAGLNRLGLTRHVAAIPDTDDFLPAVGQGAIALVTRAADTRALQAVEHIIDAATGWALAAERAYLAVLEGSCRTPIAGHARLIEGRLAFRGLVLRPDGSQSLAAAGDGPVTDAERIGRAAGQDLRSRMPSGFLSA